MDTPIELWLTAINLSQYTSTLLSHGYHTPRLCAAITDGQLADMGIAMPGHRKRIIYYLAQVHNQTLLSPTLHNLAETLSDDPTPVLIPQTVQNTIDTTNVADPAASSSVAQNTGCSSNAAETTTTITTTTNVLAEDSSHTEHYGVGEQCDVSSAAVLDAELEAPGVLMTHTDNLAAVTADNVYTPTGPVRKSIELMKAEVARELNEEPIAPPRPCNIPSDTGYVNEAASSSDVYDIPHSPHPPCPLELAPALPPKQQEGVSLRPSIPSRPVPKPRTSLLPRKPVPAPRVTSARSSPVGGTTHGTTTEDAYDEPFSVRLSSSSAESTYDNPAGMRPVLPPQPPDCPHVESGVSEDFYMAPSCKCTAQTPPEIEHKPLPCKAPAQSRPEIKRKPLPCKAPELTMADQLYDEVCATDSLDLQIPPASGSIYEEMVHDIHPIVCQLDEPIYEAPPTPPRQSGDDGLPQERVVIGAEATDTDEDIYGQVWKMSSGACVVDAPPSAHIRLSYQHPFPGTPLLMADPEPCFSPPLLPHGATFNAELHQRQSGVGADGIPSVPPRLHRQHAMAPPGGLQVQRSSCEVNNDINEQLAQSMYTQNCSTGSNASRTALPPVEEDVCCQGSPSLPRSRPDARLPHLAAAAVSKAQDNDYGDVVFGASRPLRETAKFMYDPARGTYSLDDAQPLPLVTCDSEDNLSDGGDFYEEPSEASSFGPAVHIPASGSAANSEKTILQKKGYLYKHASKASSHRGWLKRWVILQEKRLRYYSTHKSTVSRRVIPLGTIRKVERFVKAGEVHPYRFIVTTVDRIYSFASDDSDEVFAWNEMLQQGLSELGATELNHGGEMSQPDKQGFVKMDGIKVKRYFAIKGSLFCYYNTYNDYKVASPVHIIELKLATVKEMAKHRLQLINPFSSYTFVFDKESEATEWREAFEEGIAEGLGDDTIQLKVFENHSNQQCADCGMPDPKWASINYGITLCKFCAGVHRSLSTSVSKVRSLCMDFRVWTDSLVQMMNAIGNDNANNFWEWNTTEDDHIDSDADNSERHVYIDNKYIKCSYCRLHPLHTDQPALDEALCKAVQHDNLLETMQLLYSGANIHCISTTYGEGNTPLLLARAAQQPLQVEFLLRNGADTDASISSPQIQPPHQDRVPCIQGYLHKTGSNPKGEFRRRWCILENGVLSYYENKKSTVPKDSIDKSEMLSVGTSWCDRFEFTFELSTSKHTDRVYQFAAESEKIRARWIANLAKAFAQVPVDIVDQIHNLERGGVISLREGATSDWCSCWLHLHGKTLYLFTKEEGRLEEIDLRKVKQIANLQMTGQSPDNTNHDVQPFIVDLPNRALYMQCSTRKETDAWFDVIHTASMESGTRLCDQQLTADDVPVIVDKCVNFIATHGMTTEGLYRHNGQHSKVTKLLELFAADAKSVHLTLEEFPIHEVTTALKRFFRSLHEPVLTLALYDKWISATNIDDFSARMQWYKYLLGELDIVNYRTLKRMNTHLCRVAEHSSENKMTFSNLSSIFGMVFMATNQDSAMTSGFNATNQEIATVRELLENHKLLFEVKEDELEQERKISEAIKKIEQLQSVQANQVETADMLIGVYIESRAGKVITRKVSERMTSSELLDYVVEKAELDRLTNWGLFEVVCDEELERPLDVKEKVLSVTLRYCYWPEEFRRNNFLCVKERLLDEKLQLVLDASSFPLFGELRYSEKKSFKKSFFKLGQHNLNCYKDPKATNPAASWNVNDLTFYIGCQSKRAPPTRWSFTFIVNFEKIVKTRENPFFGHAICCNSEEELCRWLAGLLLSQTSQSDGPEDDIPNLQAELDMSVPVYEGFVGRPHRPSVFRRFLKR